jgi:F420-0:gamma-glutamyl ligase
MSATSTPPRNSTSDGDRSSHRTATTTRRVSTETKASFKTTELFAYLAAVVGVLIAAGVVDESNAGGFGAKQAWLYVTILTVGYMLSRGFAKSGSREP